MKKQEIKDERILAQKRKIDSDALQIVFLGLVASMIIQEYALKAPFSQYAAEAILLTIVAIYVVIRNLMAGNDIFECEKYGQKLVFINSFVCGLAVSVTNSVLRHAQQGELSSILLVAGFTFVSATLVAFVPLQILYIANRNKQKRMEAYLADKDDHE